TEAGPEAAHRGAVAASARVDDGRRRGGTARPPPGSRPYHVCEDHIHPPSTRRPAHELPEKNAHPVPGEGSAVLPEGGMRGEGLRASPLTPGRHSFGATLPSAFSAPSSSFCPAATSSLL